MSVPIFVGFFFHIVHHLPYFIQLFMSLNILKTIILSSLSGISSNSLSLDVVIVGLIILGGVNIVFVCVCVVFVGYCIEILYI